MAIEPLCNSDSPEPPTTLLTEVGGYPSNLHVAVSFGFPLLLLLLLLLLLVLLGREQWPPYALKL